MVRVMRLLLKRDSGKEASTQRMHKTYEFVCRLPVHVALARIEDLLSKEYVKYRVVNLSITSTETPIFIFNFDPRQFSRRNWVGLNPFAYVSGVDVRCQAGDNGQTKVIVCVNRFRTFLLGTFWVLWCLLLAGAVPELWAKFIPIAIACVSWFGIVSFLGDYLIKKEIGDHLKVGH